MLRDKEKDGRRMIWRWREDKEEMRAVFCCTVHFKKWEGRKENTCRMCRCSSIRRKGGEEIKIRKAELKKDKRNRYCCAPAQLTCRFKLVKPVTDRRRGRRRKGDERRRRMIRKRKERKGRND